MIKLASFSKKDRRKNIRVTLDDMSDSALLKSVLFVAFSIAFIIVLPFAIVAAPFVLAWDCVNALTTKAHKTTKLELSRWGEFTLDFDSLFNTEDDGK